jgi:Flp pilus assembly protein TadG
VSRAFERTPGRSRHPLAAFLGDAAGDELVEVAISLPIFLLAAFGLCQFAILFFSYINATYECRAAARYASTHSSASLSPVTTAQIQGLVTSSLYLNTAITPNVAVSYYTPTMAAGSNVIGNVVEVNVTWTQTFKSPYFKQKNISVGTQAYRVILR